MEQNETINNAEENTSENSINPSEEQNAETSIENEVDAAVDYDAKLAELNDRYLRLYSEFDNYRKRTIKEKSDTAFALR